MRNFDKSFSFTVGRLLCGRFRDMLNAEKFSGRDIEWMESSGWIDRTFTVRGVGSDIDATASRIQNYIEYLRSAA